MARTQSGWVADRLADAGVESRIVEVVTEGDVNLAPLTQIGGTGVFASALRHQLKLGHVDFAVHSLKDLPVAPEPGLVVAAVPVREDVHDVLISRDQLTLERLPPRATSGTGSPRRAAQVRVARPDVEVRPIRGNVETRIAHVRDGRLDAVILAYAGVRRLGLQGEVSQVIPLEQVLPAPGQGALAVECRQDDTAVRAALTSIDDSETRACVEVERTLLAVLEAGCTAPVGAFARIVSAGQAEQAIGDRSMTTPGGRATRRPPIAGGHAAARNGEPTQANRRCLMLDAFVGTETSGARIRRVAPLPEADSLGAEVAHELLGRLQAAGARIASPEDL